MDGHTKRKQKTVPPRQSEPAAAPPQPAVKSKAAKTTNVSRTLPPVSPNVSLFSVTNAKPGISELPTISLLPSPLPAKLPPLSTRSTTLLKRKQRLLSHPTSALHQLLTATHPEFPSTPELVAATSATLVFAQEEAGTAVCISPDGLLLTCSHCVAESEEELEGEGGSERLLLFADGRVVKARVEAWDAKRDLALLRVVAAQGAAPSSVVAATASEVAADASAVGVVEVSRGGRTLRSSDRVKAASTLPTCPVPSSTSETFVFPFITLTPSPPPPRTPLYCIGHPGSEDLEASRPGVQTDYDVLHVSSGQFHGYAPDQDVQDNSEIGALMHDCWTYWGHSGAPLVVRERRAKSKKKGGSERDAVDEGETSAVLVGLHSSWDNETGMRRGVGWEAIRSFLEE